MKREGVMPTKNLEENQKKILDVYDKRLNRHNRLTKSFYQYILKNRCCTEPLSNGRTVKISLGPVKMKR